MENLKCTRMLNSMETTEARSRPATETWQQATFRAHRATLARGAMLIFCVSFQFSLVPLGGGAYRPYLK